MPRLTDTQIQNFQKCLEAKRVMLECPPEHQGGTGYHRDGTQDVNDLLADLAECRKDLKKALEQLALSEHSAFQRWGEVTQQKYGWTEEERG